MSRRDRARSHLRDGLPPSRQVEPTAVEHLHVTIPLKPQDAPAAFPVHFSEALKEEYAIKYLQRLGAMPTQDNIATVLKNLPLDDCQITSAWKARGSLSDVVMVDLYPRLQPRQPSRGDDDDSLSRTRRPSASLIQQGDDALVLPKTYRVGAVCMSFDDMEQRYLLPFKDGARRHADVLAMYAMKHEEPVKFVYVPALAEIHTKPSLQLFGRRATQRRVKCIEERLNPPEAKAEFTRQMLSAFAGCLPFALLGIRGQQEKDSLFELLTSERMIDLVQTTVRYLYLEVFFKLGCLGAAGLIKTAAISSYHATAPAEIEMLFVRIARVFNKIKHSLAHDAKGITLYLPLHLLALRVAVETQYRYQYPQNFTITAPTMQYILVQMDDQISKVFDADQLLSRIGILETTCESTKTMASQPYQIRRRQTRLRDQYYQTSEALHTIFPNPISGKCRKMIKFRGGAAIANYPTPVVPASRADGAPMLKHGPSRGPGSPNRTGALPSASLTARLELLHMMEKSMPRHQPKTAR